MTHETPVVELIRVSTETQAGEDRSGIPAQRAANRQTCGRYGLRVIETVEIVESGATVATTPQMATVLDLVREGRAHGVVLAAYDRLFRPDRWTDLAILQVFADEGAHIYVPSGPIDLQTELGYVQASVNNLLAGLERRRIKERTMRAKEELRRQGKLASGTPPMGFDYDSDEGWSYTEEIETVKQIFAVFLSGEERTYAELGRRFGINQYTLQTILRRPMYAGWWIHEPRELGEPARTSGRSEWPPIEPEEDDDVIRIRLDLPPAVPLEDFQEVQRIMDRRRRRISLTRKSRSKRFLYRGMLFCSCGLPIYGVVKRNRGRTYGYYACRSMKDSSNPDCTNKHMRRPRVEDALDEVLEERLTDPDLIAAAVETYNESLLAAWRGSLPSPEEDRRRREALERKRNRILNAFFDGLIDVPERDERLATVDDQLEAIPTEEDRAPEPPPELEPDQILDVLQVFAEWSYLERAQQRKLLEALAPAFILDRYRIEGVHLTCVPKTTVSRTATPERPRN